VKHSYLPPQGDPASSTDHAGFNHGSGTSVQALIGAIRKAKGRVQQPAGAKGGKPGAARPPRGQFEGNKAMAGRARAQAGQLDQDANELDSEG
jgi:hypothetical protein